MRFDETLKRTFNRPNDACFVPFGAALDRDPEYGIRSGKLRMNGYVAWTIVKHIRANGTPGKT